jgi:hypothetical protein
LACQPHEPNPSGTSTFPSASSVYPFDGASARRPVGEGEREADERPVVSQRGTVLSSSTARRTVLDSRDASLPGPARDDVEQLERQAEGGAVPNGGAGPAPAAIDDEGAAMQGAGGTDIMQGDHGMTPLPADVLIDAGPEEPLDAGMPPPHPPEPEPVESEARRP